MASKELTDLSVKMADPNAWIYANQAGSNPTPTKNPYVIPTGVSSNSTWWGVNPTGGAAKPVSMASSQNGVSSIVDMQKKIDETSKKYETPPPTTPQPEKKQTTAEDAIVNETLTPQEKEDAQKRQDTADYYDSQKRAWDDFTAQMKQSVDSSTAGIIDSLTNQYEQRKAQLVDLNRRQQAMVSTSLLRSGASKYTSEISQGIIGAEESASISRLNGLEQSFRQAVAEAKVAGETKKYELMAKSYDTIRSIEDKRRDELKKLVEETSKRNEEIRKKEIQSSRDDAVAGLIEQGITDPVRILGYLNYNDAGEKVGDFTTKEVIGILNDLDTDRDEIRKVADKLTSNGADPSVIGKVLSARTYDEALTIAGPLLEDPKTKIELANLKLEAENKRLANDKLKREIMLIDEYDGLTPSEYRKKLKEEKDEIEKAKDEEEKKRLQGNALENKIILLGSVLDSDAIDSVVGPNFLARAATGFWGEAGRLAAGGLPAFQGAKDYFTGAADRLVGQTEQFISKEFLQNLIDVKAQGATFGALQKSEQDALTAAASFIGQRRIYKGKGEDKRVVGYDMSEKDFKKELKTIKDLTRKAHERATGKIFTSDEERELDNLYPENTVVSGDSFY